MKMKSTSVKCPRCKGSGKVAMGDLMPSLQQIVSLMQKHPKSLWTARTVREAIGDFRITTTAFNNRLEALRTMGFVTRQQDGRKWLYSLTK